MRSFEQINSKQIAQENLIAQLRLKQMNEMHSEKEAALIKHENAKEEWFKAAHEKELSELARSQKEMLERLIAGQQAIMQSKKSTAANITVVPQLELVNSVIKSTSEAELLREISDTMPSSNEIKELNGKASIQETLKALFLRHASEMFALEKEIQKDIALCQANFENEKMGQQIQHREESAALLVSQQKEISELRLVQEKEIHMEESMHDSEMKMLVERRILNSVLETVADGSFCLPRNN